MTHVPRPQGHSPRPAVPLTVLCGFDQHEVADAAAALLLAGSRLALIWVDPFTAELGYVQTRVTDSDGRCTDQTVSLGRGGLSCTLLVAVTQTVRRLRRTGRYDAVLIHLHPGIDAYAAVDGLVEDLAGVAVVDTVALSLHPGWLHDLAGDATALAKDIALTGDDDRFAAPILAACMAAATVIIVPADSGRAANPVEHALLSILAPDAVHLRPATPFDVTTAQLVRTGGFQPEMLDPFASRALLDTSRVLPAECGSLRLVRWVAGRPVHPQRLHDAISELADGVIRSAGYLKLATRPHQIVYWDSAGSSLVIGLPETLPAAQGGAAHPTSNIRQLGQWPARHHPAGLSRPAGNHLAFLGNDLDGEHIRQVLDSCLLTDAELSAGPAAWRQINDPFPQWEEGDHTAAGGSTETA